MKHFMLRFKKGSKKSGGESSVYFSPIGAYVIFPTRCLIKKTAINETIDRLIKMLDEARIS